MLDKPLDLNPCEEKLWREAEQILRDEVLVAWRNNIFWKDDEEWKKANQQVNKDMRRCLRANGQDESEGIIFAKTLKLTT